VNICFRDAVCTDERLAMNFKLLFLLMPLCIGMCSQSVLSAVSPHASVLSNVSVQGINSSSVFFLKRIKLERIHGDSVIAKVNTTLDSAWLYYANENYPGADMFFTEVVKMWDDYVMFTEKRKLTRKITRDSLETIVSDCKLLWSLQSPLDQVSTLLFPITSIPDELVLHKRQDVLDTLKKAENAINVIAEASGNKSAIVLRAFSKPLQHISSIRECFDKIYDQEKNNFSLKSRFNFNRAVDSKDTLQLRNFADDCDYYKVDKEWCRKAKEMLGDTTITTIVMQNLPDAHRKLVKGKPVKMTAVDSMHNAYKLATESKDIKLLESYISVYTSRKFKKSDSKIDSAAMLLQRLKNDKAHENNFFTSHPLLSERNNDSIALTLKGIDPQYQALFANAVNELSMELKNATGLRAPVTLTIEQTSDGLNMFFLAYSYPSYDLKVQNTSDSVVYSFDGVAWTVNFLHKIKQHVLKEFSLNNNMQTMNNAVYMNSLLAPVYIVRLRKNESQDLTMYAYSSQQTIAEPKYFPFYDISDSVKKNVRFTNVCSEKIIINKTLDTDSAAGKMLANFARK
jgi:hypothetical protein